MKLPLMLGAVVLVPAQVSARDAGADPPLGTFRSADWAAEARYFGDHADGPQYICTLTTKDIRVVQTRPSESPQMLVQWFFFPDRNVDPPRLRWARMGRKFYEVERLPWRLARPNPEGIVLASESPLLAVRARPTAQWLPFEYLTLAMVDLDAFTIGYEVKENGRPSREERRTVSLKGFQAATKWCGGKLLHDRRREQRVRDLTR